MSAFAGVSLPGGENKDWHAKVFLDLGVSIVTRSSLFANHFEGGVESPPAPNCHFSPHGLVVVDGLYGFSGSPNSGM